MNSLKRKKYENPYIHDTNGKNLTNPTDIYNTIRQHFNNHFNDPNIQNLTPFEGQPRKLNNKITTEEVTSNIKRLNNNRAAGNDRISIELVKYAPNEVHNLISNIINESFQYHQELAVGNGILVALQKPGKPKGPVKNLRPIILLPVLRKILSSIVLQRIKTKVENYLSQSQSAYRPNRSTSDIVWAHRWIVAKTQTTSLTVHIAGIDMSSAFDTIRREQLIEILKIFLDEDEVRIIRLLFKSNTTLDIRMNNVETEPFTSNIGSPQGDGISGVLFDIYFEASLRKIREKLNLSNITSKTNLPEEDIYADDADFITIDEQRRKRLQNIVGSTLLEDNLKVNETKTEHTIIYRGDRNTEQWRTVKKLGSLLGDTEDITRRKQLATVAMNDLNNIWIRTNHNEKLRLKLYNSLVKPVLLYNSSTWGLTKKDEDELNSFHRQQLQ